MLERGANLVLADRKLFILRQPSFTEASRQLIATEYRGERDFKRKRGREIVRDKREKNTREENAKDKQKEKKVKSPL